MLPGATLSDCSADAIWCTLTGRVALCLLPPHRDLEPARLSKREHRGRKSALRAHRYVLLLD